MTNRCGETTTGTARDAANPMDLWKGVGDNLEAVELSVVAQTVRVDEECLREIAGGRRTIGICELPGLLSVLLEDERGDKDRIIWTLGTGIAVTHGTQYQTIYNATFWGVIAIKANSRDEVRGIQARFRAKAAELIPGCKVADSHPQSSPNHQPDFWIEVKESLFPVEVKRGAFNKKALVQLQRYMRFYGCNRGFAVAPDGPLTSYFLATSSS